MRLDPRGTIAACMAFVLWGVFPVYWKLLGHMNPLDLIAHRTVWSLVVLLPLVWWLTLNRRSQGAPLSSGSASLVGSGGIRWGRTLAVHSLASLLLATNWLIYIWATINERIIEAALGYFLNPLANVLLGALLLGERLSRRQTIAILLAALGVAVQVVAVGYLPWVALVLALTFACYGLLGKKSPLGSVRGLTIETSIAFPLALGWLWWQSGWNWFGEMDRLSTTLVLALGVITAIPLILFGIGARRLPLSTLGLLQFIAPTLQFLCGWWIYGEPLGVARTASFVIIWTALAIFIWHSRPSSAVSRETPKAT